MRLSPKLGIIVMAVLLMILLTLPACGGGGEKETPSPTAQPTVAPTETAAPTTAPTETAAPTAAPTETPQAQGPTWVYNVSYEDENTVWTNTVTGEETVEGVDCYVVTTTFDANPFRYANPTGTPIKLLEKTDYISKATLDLKQSASQSEAMGMLNLTSTQTYTYSTSDHGQPYSFGDSYSVDNFTHLVPDTLAPDFTDTIDIEVVAIEDVTVPAGTFRCYKLEYTKVATDGEAVEPMLLHDEWWSAEYNLLGPVKVVEYGLWQSPETRELVSYEPLPKANAQVPEPTAKPQPTETPEVTPTPEATETPEVTPTPEATEAPPSGAAASLVYNVNYNDT